MLLSGHFARARRVVRIDVVASPRDGVAMSHAGLLRWVSCRGPASNVSARVPGHHLQVIKPLRLAWLCA